VGYYVNTTGVTQALTEHWNGAQWSVVPSPSPGSTNNELLSVAAISATDVWAVGFTSNNSPNDQTLIEHWNGTQWRVAPSPNPGVSSDHLEGVAAVSATDVWAVGTGVTASGQALIEHWNGARWQVVSSPSPGSGGDLRDVAADSTGDVWAVGYDISTTAQTLTEQWDGTRWSVVTSGNVGTSPTTFSGVAAISASDVWAVGNNLNSGSVFQGLTEQWDGAQWRVVKSPNSSTVSAQLLGVAAVTTADIWAVGHADGNTLIEHYSC
jgi:hypothetical protein